MNLPKSYIAGEAQVIADAAQKGLAEIGKEIVNYLASEVYDAAAKGELYRLTRSADKLGRISAILMED